jgi:hypothetical protein
MQSVYRKPVFFLIIASALTSPFAEDTAWVSMFNGKDLEGWTPYFSKTGLKNTDSTFQYSPEGYFFVNQRQSKNTTGFGHLFYTRKKLSYYMARAIYRFTSETTAPGFSPSGDQPQNNGLMIHSQAPNTMNGKDFPTSSECQLLGPKNALNNDQRNAGFKNGTSANLCVSGITVNYNGNDISSNCWHANYPSAWKNTDIPFEDKDGWSDVLVRVLGDSLIQHFIHGEKVLEFSRIRAGGSALKDGYLAIQAEGTPTQFKVLDYVDLTGCMDKTSANYRTYFVKSDPTLCQPTHLAPEDRRTHNLKAPRLRREGNRLVLSRLFDPTAIITEVRRVDGIREAVPDDSQSFAPSRPGLYLVSIRSSMGRDIIKIIW